MPSTPPWAADPFSEAPCSRSKPLWELPICREVYSFVVRLSQLAESRANRDLSAIKQRLAPGRQPTPEACPESSPGESTSGKSLGRVVGNPLTEIDTAWASAQGSNGR